MHLLKNTLLSRTVLMVILLTFCACGQSGDKDNKKTSSPCTIRISGAWALYPMMIRWADEYQKTHPGCKIDIAAGGAGKGVAEVLTGLVDIGMVSRNIKPEELQRGAKYVPVVKDAVFPVMNASNPILREIMFKGLTKKQFIALWIEGKTFTWGQLTSGTNGDAVNLYTRSDSCGAAETWAAYLGKHQEELQGVGVYGDPGVTEAVKNDKLGIGYNNLNYAYDIKTGLPQKGIRIIPIDISENGRVDPEEDLSTKEKAIQAVRKGLYPSPPARDLNIVVKGQFSGPVRNFVLWILNDGQRFVDEIGYIKLSDTQIQEAITKVKN
ncbi:MAG: PstS family phosphate ABC transporter substrate-binding protein [Smithellaceae bacterium]